MASTQTWSEYQNAVEAPSVTNNNWKSVDNADTGGATAYTANPITAGNNSYSKVQALKFGGTYASLSAFTYKISANSGTGWTVNGNTTSTPAANVSTGDSVATAPLSTTGVNANFASSTSPFSAGATSTTVNPMYAQALRTQLVTASTASPGDITALTITATWTEA